MSATSTCWRTTSDIRTGENALRCVVIFDEDERGPDDELKLQLEAISQFAPEDKVVVKRVLDSLILSNEAKRWSSAS